MFGNEVIRNLASYIIYWKSEPNIDCIRRKYKIPAVKNDFGKKINLETG